MDIALLVEAIERAAEGRQRFIVAVAGPPASGKSTLAAALAERLPNASAAAMDGFHYDDAVLRAKGLASRKGAPETFDFDGFCSLVERLRRADADVAIPLFDRSLELSRNAAAIIERDKRFVVVEGNYLLLDELPWVSLAPLFDFSVFIDVEESELDRRLVDRWRHHGRADDAARAWIDSNDMPNIKRVLSARRRADLVI